MSSVYFTSSAAYATDGNSANRATTNNEPNPWLAIDLGKGYPVASVYMTNTDNPPYGRTHIG